MMNYYEILGVTPSASQDELREAFRQLVKQHHPDLFHMPIQKLRATKKMQEINVAYENLSDPDKRRKYDEAYSKAKAKSDKSVASQKPSRSFDADEIRRSEQRVKVFLWLILIAWGAGTAYLFMQDWTAHPPSGNYISLTLIRKMITAGIMAVVLGFFGLMWAFTWIVGIAMGALMIVGMFFVIKNLFIKTQQITAKQSKRSGWVQVGSAIGVLALLLVPIIIPYWKIPLPRWIEAILIIALGWVWIIIPLILTQVVAMLTALLWTNRVVKKANALLAR